MPDLVTGHLTLQDIQNNTVYPVIHDEKTLTLMGVSVKGMDALLTCAGLPTIAEFEATHPDELQVLSSLIFYTALHIVLSNEDTSIVETNDGHVVTKFSAKSRGALRIRAGKLRENLIMQLKVSLNLDIKPRPLASIGVSPNTAHTKRTQLCRNQVENTLS